MDLKWKQLICDKLYEIARLRKTITYLEITEFTNYDVQGKDLFSLLSIISEEEYIKHGIFISAVAVRNFGLRLPSNGFKKVLKGKKIKEHVGLNFESICRLEKKRTQDFAKNNRYRKLEIPNVLAL